VSLSRAAGGSSDGRRQRPGHPRRQHRRIFEASIRPAGRRGVRAESGLGLSISRQIVEAHGGTLTAQNIPGAKPGEIRGARFTVTLPADG